MKYDPPDELHIVGHHFPIHFVTAHEDVFAHQPPARFPHRCVRRGEKFIEDRLSGFLELGLQLFDP